MSTLGMIYIAVTVVSLSVGAAFWWHDRHRKTHR